MLLCIAVFAGLLTVATFYDLRISDILTADALADGNYNTNHWFAGTFEIIGSNPVYLGFALAFHLLYHYGDRNLKGAKKGVMMTVTAVLSVVAYYAMISSMYGYMEDILLMEFKSFRVPGGYYTKLVFVACALALTALGTLAVKNLSDDTIKKLFRFAFAVIIVAALPSILVNLVFKSPIGRIRYRAMNLYPDNPTFGFAAFSPWYEWKGQWIEKETMLAAWGNTDILKSCPSGHTASAATSYALIMLNDALGIKNRKIRALNWLLPILWTGVVAVSRIVAGAHFMSDVLFGGSLTFLTMIIAREILVCRGSNVKALFGGKG